MSKNINQRYFAEFLTVLALTIDPDPTIVNEEPEIYITEEDLEKHRNGTWSSKSSRKNSVSSSSSEESAPKHGLLNVEEEVDFSIDAGAGGGDGLDAKQKMMVKKGKVAVSANRKIQKSETAIKRMRRR